MKLNGAKTDLLYALEGDMVSFAEACLFSAREGEAKFWITLYMLSPSMLPPWLFRLLTVSCVIANRLLFSLVK